MNRHVGASFTLSVLIVVFFAVVLYQPDHARRPRVSHPRGEPTAPAPQVAPTTAPAPTPGVPLSEAMHSPILDPTESPRLSDEPTATTPRASRTETDRGPKDAAAARTTAGISPDSTRLESPAMIQIASRRHMPRPPRRTAFTQVGEGESLTDVAIRVYGTSEAARILWLANRDVIDRRDTPLRLGALLRTP